MKIKKIYLGQRQIRPDVQWQPWPNTVAYYKFESNLNDSSGNNRNLSWGTFTYWTLQTGARYIQTSSGQYTNNYTSMPFNTNSYTINIRACADATTTSWTLVDLHTNKSNFPRFATASTNKFTFTTNPTNITTTINAWHNYVCVCKNGTAYCYIDGVQQTTKGLNSHNANLNYFRLNTVGYADASLSNFTRKGKMSELILESKDRTNDEIIQYYNHTKANYWIN